MAVHVVWEGEGCGSVDECIKAVQGREKGGPGRDGGRAVDAQQEAQDGMAGGPWTLSKSFDVVLDFVQKLARHQRAPPVLHICR